MAPIVTTIEINLTPLEVFAYATDPTRFGEWQADVVEVRLDGEGARPAVGTRFTTTRRIGRSQRTMTQEITEITPPRRWAACGVAGAIRPSASITVEPAGDGRRSRVTFSLDFGGHGVGVPLVPVVRRQAQRGAPLSYATLKRRLETGTHPRTQG